jgi:hypothetical protein
MGKKIPVVALGSPPPSADEFQIYTAKPDVRFLSKAVQPPSQVYVDVGDDIVVSAASSQVNEAVTVSYRLLRFDGELVLGQFQIRPPSNRSVITYQESLAEGFLLSVSCKANIATTRGQTFVRIFLTDPALGSGQPSYMLMADYVTTQMAPATPGGRVLSPAEGPGWSRSLSFASPGAGNPWIVSVPLNARWRIKNFFATFGTDGVAGNRSIGVAILQNGLFTYGALATQVQGPSLNVSYCGAALTPHTGAVAGISQLPIPPDLTLLGNDKIESLMFTFDPGDLWTTQNFAVEEWLDNV